MPKKRKPVSQIRRDLEPTLFAVSAFVSQAEVHAWNLGIDMIDEDVIADQLEATGNHLAEALWTLHPEWRRMTHDEHEREALVLFRRYLPDDVEAEPVDVLQLCTEAVARCRQLVMTCWRASSARYADIGIEVDCAIDHLLRIIYVLDRSVLDDPRLDDPRDTASDRAERLMEIEIDVAAHREHIRTRTPS